MILTENMHEQGFYKHLPLLRKDTHDSSILAQYIQNLIKFELFEISLNF